MSKRNDTEFKTCFYAAFKSLLDNVADKACKDTL